MSIFVISDIHATDRWREMLVPRQAGDRAIFLGDYFDERGSGPFVKSQTGNFLEICAYARSHPHTTLLMGNHDYQYLPSCVLGASDRDETRRAEYGKALQDNMDILDMVLVVNRMLFSHGGVTATFVKNCGLASPHGLNDYWREHPEAFDFLIVDPASGRHFTSPYGDDPWQGPTWARNNALYEDGFPGYDQIIGHTPVPQPCKFFTKNGDGVIMTCDFSAAPLILPDDNCKEALEKLPFPD